MIKCIALLLSSFLVGAGAESVREVAHVVEMRGPWNDDHYGKSIKQFYQLREDSSVVRKGVLSKSDYIRIRFFLNNQDVLFDCGKPLVCEGPLDLKRQLKASIPANPLEAFWQAIVEMIQGDSQLPERHRSAISRANSGADINGLPQLLDGIALIDPAGLDMSNIFQNAQGGLYLLELCPASQDGTYICNPKPDTTTFAWKPGQSVMWGKRNVAPGLFRLNLCENVEGRILRSQQFVYLVTAKTQNYGRIQGQFSTVAYEIRQWTITDSTATPLLRVYLQYLNQKENR